MLANIRLAVFAPASDLDGESLNRVGQDVLDIADRAAEDPIAAIVFNAVQVIDAGSATVSAAEQGSGVGHWSG
ncbi:MAG: hypothetical protein ABI882_14715 [Acidobacteriota bacterium]